MKHLMRRERMLPELTQIFLLFVYSILLILQVEWVFRQNAVDTLRFTYQHPVQFWYQTLFVFLITLLVYYIFRQLSIAVAMSGALLVSLGIANYIKASTRSEPFLPWDLTVIKDASEIADRSHVVITPQVVLSIVFVAVCFVLLLIFHKRLRPIRMRLAVRVGTAALVAGSLPVMMGCVFMNTNFLEKHNITEIQWNQIDNYKENGVVFSFLNNFSHRSVEAPSNYSSQSVNAAVSTIKKQATSASTQAKTATVQKPNIIYIQSEALCDLSLFQNIQFSEDIMPTIHSLQQTALSGYALTPMFGGGTCNSEMEVLTGFSYSYLPTGSVPYEQYFKTSTFSYASYLKNLGYSTVAVHPFDPEFWDRSRVFPNIGFDSFISQNDFVNPERKRDFISDMEAMKMIVSQYQQNKSTGKPFFNMTITMQNHYAWGLDDYPESERVTLTSAPGLTDYEKGVITTYATGVRDADAALKYLVDYFSSVSDPTIVVFYGDHLPALDQNTLKTGGLIQGNSESAENVRKLHSTPYIIWSNYANLPHQTANMSMYQLSAYMTRMFNLPRPLYFDYLGEQYQAYRGYATGVYIDGNGNATMKMPAGAQDDWNKQWLFEYDMLIGNQYGKALTQ